MRLNYPYYQVSFVKRNIYFLKQICYDYNLFRAHCTENPIEVFPDIKLHSCICERFLYYIPRISLPIWLQQNKQTNPYTWLWKLGDRTFWLSFGNKEAAQFGEYINWNKTFILDWPFNCSALCKFSSVRRLSVEKNNWEEKISPFVTFEQNVIVIKIEANSWTGGLQMICKLSLHHVALTTGNSLPPTQNFFP
jgi:hypothetical protein